MSTDSATSIQEKHRKFHRIRKTTNNKLFIHSSKPHYQHGEAPRRVPLALSRPIILRLAPSGMLTKRESAEIIPEIIPESQSTIPVPSIQIERKPAADRTNLDEKDHINYRYNSTSLPSNQTRSNEEGEADDDEAVKNSKNAQISEEFWYHHPVEPLLSYKNVSRTLRQRPRVGIVSPDTLHPPRIMKPSSICKPKMPLKKINWTISEDLSGGADKRKKYAILSRHDRGCSRLRPKLRVPNLQLKPQASEKATGKAYMNSLLARVLKFVGPKASRMAHHDLPEGTRFFQWPIWTPGSNERPTDLQ